MLPLRRAVLFGSWAKGRQTVASDVDLLVVYRGVPRSDADALVKRTLGIRGLEAHCYTDAEYLALAATLDRMTAGGIELPLRPP
ncbi:MAG: nucleotidyltransferase domain-containing protein [Candidatus Rokuibacteriota bacterium]